MIHIQYTNSEKKVWPKTSECGTGWSLGNAEILFDWFRSFIADLSYSESYDLARTQSRKLGQCPILAKKDTFFKQSGLHQNKASHNFHKRGQRPMAERIKVLD